jgi:hypothetical protein
MATMWYQDNCPHCDAENWISNGDPRDMTAADCGPLVICHACDKPFDMTGESSPEEIDPDDCEEGSPRPS